MKETVYTVIDTKDGEEIDETTDITIAQRVVMEYEREDCDNEDFEPNRYEIKEWEREVESFVDVLERILNF